MTMISLNNILILAKIDLPFFLFLLLIVCVVFLIRILPSVIISVIGYLPLCIEAKAAGIPFGLLDCYVTQFQKLKPREIVDALKMLHKAGVRASASELRNHILSGGNLKNVRNAAVAVDKAGLNIGFQEIARLDLAGRDIAAAVHDHVFPKVLQIPQPGPGYENGLVGVSRDGISLGIKTRVTVRTRMDKLVGGAGEPTIIARVGQGIVTAIGCAKSHREIMENPSIIADEIIRRGLDRGTCYEILSLDIEDINVLDNVAARLRSIQAEADKRIARARSEERRANAVAQAQEMKAKTVSAEADVIASKSVLPRSEANALAHARLGNPKPLVITDLRL